MPHLNRIIIFCFAALITQACFPAQALDKVTSNSRAKRTTMSRPINKTSTWANVSQWSDPTSPLLEQFLKDQISSNIQASTVTSLDYIRLAADNATYWLKYQDATGAIIDPYRKEEWQYSTPCFALACIASVKYLDRKDLLEPGTKAMDWACLTLSEGRAANHHEDFYPPVLAHALVLFQDIASPGQTDKWKKQLAGYDPYVVYRATPGKNNWNVVALSGEYLLYKQGLRKNLDFVEDSLAGQGVFWGSPHGLYLEGPMAYDHFPRLWAADMVAQGYSGKYAAGLDEMLRRAAITSLFIQSPWGELPLGHRSAHHQWNEAEQCVTYEIYGARAAREGKSALAGAFKRAAHLAFSSMKRWQRPSGELYINKNKVEPSEAHGYEVYSGHSQYNLLPMAMLVMAHEHAAATENVAELPAPADVGGFVVHLPELHKVFANAAGGYIELETSADLHYDVTGLVRLHFKGCDPQLGPSDVLTTKTNYKLPKVDRVAAAIGPTWVNSERKASSLAEYGLGAIRKFDISGISASPGRVSFSAKYEADFSGPQAITQEFDLTSASLTMATRLADFQTTGAIEWPLFADNGKEETKIALSGNSVTNSLGTSAVRFTVPEANSLRVSKEKYPNRNGWARLAKADFPANTTMTLTISPILQP